MAPNSKFKILVNKIAAKLSQKANFKISSKNIRRVAIFRAYDWDWAKSANGDTVDFVEFLRFFGHLTHNFKYI